MVNIYYCSRVYDNFNELMESSYETARMLLKQLDLTLSDIKDEPWANNQLVLYFSLEDYAAYELADGWYSDCNFYRDFNGAPSPIEYVDLADFGEALIERVDSSVCLQLPNGRVVTTEYGW